MKTSINKIDLSKDTEIIFKIDQSAYNRNFDYPATKIEDAIEHSKDCLGFFYLSNDIPVGMIYYIFKDDKNIEIKSLAIIPEFQHQGIGKILLEKVINENPGKNFYLVTHPKNSGAIILYLKSGFQIYGWKDNYWGDGEPRLLLKRIL